MPALHEIQSKSSVTGTDILGMTSHRASKHNITLPDSAYILLLAAARCSKLARHFEKCGKMLHE